MATKSKKFRQLLHSSKLEFILESHNGISAKIAEESGFKGIWASGLAISASLGVRDNNEASWTQVLDVIEFMSDSTSVPILLDGDTGYGNYNNARRLVRKLEQRDIAGVCIEDKIFPKTNSFISGDKQPLADVEEFSGKIKAMKDAQVDKNFTVVARLESFITGWGLENALERAQKYYEAGADAILVHSKIKSFNEIKSFTKVWKNKCPIIIVPTTYYETTASEIEKEKISMVIWANHMIRSSVTAMRRVASTIQKEKSLISVEKQIATVKEIFKIQNADELKTADKKYLPLNEDVSAIVLAASHGPEFGNYTKNKPKTMVKFNGLPILQHIKNTLLLSGIKNMVVVGGYKHEAIDIKNIHVINNNRWKTTGNTYSLYKASEYLLGTKIISYGDLVYESSLINSLLETPGDIVIATDVSDHQSNKEYNYFVKGKDQPSDEYGSKDWTALKDIKLGKTTDSSSQWIGLIKLSPKGCLIFKRNFENFFNDKGKKSSLGDYLKFLIDKKVKINIRYSRGKWYDLDNKRDLESFLKNTKK
tara:strand:+ start:2318 stop:3925 length:1608 start_codon:yes stop_codon:yes gene_type:complete